MAQSKLFKSNKSQAVRLPKHLEFPENVKRVEIVPIGKARLISPEGHSWDSFFDGPRMSDDFMTERIQPEQKRKFF